MTVCRGLPGELLLDALCLEVLILGDHRVQPVEPDARLN